MKKLVSLFLACLMVLSIGMIPAFATTETEITYTVAEGSLTADTALASKPTNNYNTEYCGTNVTVGNYYKTATGVMVRDDGTGNKYFELAADTVPNNTWYEHKLSLSKTISDSNTLKRFTAKIKLPSLTGSTYVFSQKRSWGLAGTTRILDGFGVRLVAGEALYYDAATKAFVNFLDDEKSIEANKWYTIEAVMDARATNLYMNAFVYDDAGELIGNSAWQHVGTTPTSAGWRESIITAAGYELESKVLVDNFKEYVLSDVPTYTFEEPTYPQPTTITETYTNNYIAATTNSSWYRTVGEKFNITNTNTTNNLGNGSKNTAARYNMSFRIPEFGSSFYFMDFIAGQNMPTSKDSALDGVAKVDSTGVFSAKAVDDTAVALTEGTSYQLTANTWYNLEALVDYSTFDVPKATVYLKDAKGNVLTQSAQQYTIAKIPNDESDAQYCRAVFMWVGMDSTNKAIHFDNIETVIAPTYADVLANTNLTVVNKDSFEAHAEGTTYATLLDASVEGAIHVHDSRAITGIQNATVAVEEYTEQVTVVKDIDFKFTYDKAVPNANISYSNIKLLEGDAELTGGTDYIVTPASDGGIDGAETSKNFTIVMPKLRVNTTYTIRLMAGLSDYNTALTGDKAIKYGLPADNGLYKDFTFTTPEAAKETTIVSSLVDDSDAAVVALTKDAVIKGKVDINNNDEDSITGYVILGIYDGNELVTALISETVFSAESGATVSADTPTYTVAKDGLTAKVFVWNGLTKMQPLVAAEVVPAPAA